MRFVWMAAMVLGSGVGFAQQQPDLSDFEKQAKEVAVVTLDGAALRQFTPLLSKEADNRELMQALSAADSLQVTALEFDGKATISPAEFAARLAKSGNAGWTPFLDAHSNETGETFTGYAGREGLLLASFEENQFAMIYVRGVIDPAHATAFSHHFGFRKIPKGSCPRTGMITRPDVQSVLRRPDKLDFGGLVQAVEHQTGTGRLHVPFLWLAGPAAFLGSAGSVRGVHLAVFENAPETFAAAVEASVPKGWLPMVNVRERNESTRIYVGEITPRMNLVVATRDSHEGVLVTARVSLDELCKDPLKWRGGRFDQ